MSIIYTIYDYNTGRESFTRAFVFYNIGQGESVWCYDSSVDNIILIILSFYVVSLPIPNIKKKVIVKCNYENFKVH